MREGWTDGPTWYFKQCGWDLRWCLILYGLSVVDSLTEAVEWVGWCHPDSSRLRDLTCFEKACQTVWCHTPSTSKTSSFFFWHQKQSTTGCINICHLTMNDFTSLQQIKAQRFAGCERRCLSVTKVLVYHCVWFLLSLAICLIWHLPLRMWRGCTYFINMNARLTGAPLVYFTLCGCPRITLTLSQQADCSHSENIGELCFSFNLKISKLTAVENNV